MVQFFCCHCTTRVAVISIAVISTLHFAFEGTSIVAVEGEHRLMESSADGYFYSVLASQAFMIFASILLGLGAYFVISWFCIPWLCITLLNILYHIVIMVIIIYKLIVTMEDIVLKLEMLLLILLSTIILSYMAMIVWSFISEVNSGGGRKGDDEERQPLMKEHKHGRHGRN